MLDNSADEARHMAAQICGALCPECGISWWVPSPQCPHRIRNLHPLAKSNEAPTGLWMTTARWTDIVWCCGTCEISETGNAEVIIDATMHAASTGHVVTITRREHHSIAGMRY